MLLATALHKLSSREQRAMPHQLIVMAVIEAVTVIVLQLGLGEFSFGKRFNWMTSPAHTAVSTLQLLFRLRHCTLSSTPALSFPGLPWVLKVYFSWTALLPTRFWLFSSSTIVSCCSQRRLGSPVPTVVSPSSAVCGGITSRVVTRSLLSWRSWRSSPRC